MPSIVSHVSSEKSVTEAICRGQNPACEQGSPLFSIESDQSNPSLVKIGYQMGRYPSTVLDFTKSGKTMVLCVQMSKEPPLERRDAAAERYDVSVP